MNFPFYRATYRATYLTISILRNASSDQIYRFISNELIEHKMFYRLIKEFV